jgi:hypothetical protein
LRAWGCSRCSPKTKVAERALVIVVLAVVTGVGRLVWPKL